MILIKFVFNDVLRPPFVFSPWDPSPSTVNRIAEVGAEVKRLYHVNFKQAQSAKSRVLHITSVYKIKVWSTNLQSLFLIILYVLGPRQLRSFEYGRHPYFSWQASKLRINREKNFEWFKSTLNSGFTYQPDHVFQWKTVTACRTMS